MPKIIDIRLTASFGWVLDVQECILPYSISLCVPMSEMDEMELFTMLSDYANTDPEHVAIHDSLVIDEGSISKIHNGKMDYSTPAPNEIHDPRTPEQMEMDILYRENKETHQSLI